MWQTFLFSLIIVVICLVLLAVRLFFGKKFVHTHVDGNKAMHRKGIRCAQSMDAEERRDNPYAVSEKSKN